MDFVLQLLGVVVPLVGGVWFLAWRLAKIDSHLAENDREHKKIEAEITELKAGQKRIEGQLAKVLKNGS